MKRLTPKEIKKIKSLHEKGKSERVIAKEIGCARSTVWYHLQKLK